VKEEKYRDLLIKFSGVPEEIQKILPESLEALEAYLESDSYKELKAKLAPKEPPKAPKVPKPKSRTYTPPQSDSLSAIGRLFSP
jgi:hypothetical protein